MRFYLGTHEPHWLARPEFVGIPLFISAHRLRRRPPKRWRPATTRWACDSGGFTRLSEHGHWDITPEAYAAEVRVWHDQIGGLDWSAPQDWMCEDLVVASVGVYEGLLAPAAGLLAQLREEFRARRRRPPTAREDWLLGALACRPLDPAFHAARIVVHQRRTIDSLLALRRIAPDLTWVPVLQGQAVEEYLAHARMYADAGVDLTGEETVGVGSVCRRQDTAEAEELMRRLRAGGISAHGFGFKVGGLDRCWDVLHSADSLAWSFQATKRPALAGCTHKRCNNCVTYALDWRARMLDRTGGERPPVRQPSLF